jgi:hypothetical protein
MVLMLIWVVFSNFVLGCLVGALILQYALKKQEGRTAGFGTACLTMLLTLLAYAPLAVLFGWMRSKLGLGWRWDVAAHAVLLPVGFLILSALIGWRHALPFRKGVRVAIRMLGVVLRIAAAIGAIVFAAWYATHKK